MDVLIFIMLVLLLIPVGLFSAMITYGIISALIITYKNGKNRGKQAVQMDAVNKN